jgi:glutamate-1-semialdehyde 2,1-aminomutase
METGVYVSGTFNANPVCVAAGISTIQQLQKPGAYAHLERITRRLIKEVGAIVRKKDLKARCDGECGIWQLTFGIEQRMKDYRETFLVDKAAYQKLRKACMERGVRLHPTRGRFYTSMAHDDADVDATVRAISESLNAIF